MKTFMAHAKHYVPSDIVQNRSHNGSHNVIRRINNSCSNCSVIIPLQGSTGPQSEIGDFVVKDSSPVYVRAFSVGILCICALCLGYKYRHGWCSKRKANIKSSFEMRSESSLPP